MSTEDLALALALADRADALTSARFGALDLRIDTKPDLTPVTNSVPLASSPRGPRGMNRCARNTPKTATSRISRPNSHTHSG